jgi:hypothetical protein
MLVAFLPALTFLSDNGISAMLVAFLPALTFLSDNGISAMLVAFLPAFTFLSHNLAHKIPGTQKPCEICSGIYYKQNIL